MQKKVTASENVIMSAYNLDDMQEEVPIIPNTPQSPPSPPGLEEGFSMDKKGVPRDRDSGVSSLKSLRVIISICRLES